MTTYIDNATHRRLKSRLTRAKNSGDPNKVLAEVKNAVETWGTHAWPDDWSHWKRAAEDAIPWGDPRQQEIADLFR